jgi:hypothetical protein
MAQIIHTITSDRARADGTTWQSIAACGHSNAETAATAYVEGDFATAGRLWAQSDKLLTVAENMRRREISHAA